MSEARVFAPRAEERLLLLLRAAILPQESIEAPIPPLSEEEEERLYALAKKQDLDHLILPTAERLGIELSPALCERYQKRMLLALYRDERMSAALVGICGALSAEGIPYLPLKGAVLRDLYPETWLRTSCDIDILVREEDLDRAVGTLSSVGYHAEEKRNYHDIHLSSEEGPPLELHFHIGEDMPALDRVLLRVWEHTAPESAGAARHRMTPAFFLFHLLAHAAYHFVHGGCGIRPFADLYLYRRAVSCDEAELSALLAEAGLTDFFAAALRLCEVWFGEGEGDTLTGAMQGFLLGGGIYGTDAQSLALESAGRGGKLGFYLGRLFPPLRRMAVRYPVLREHPCLLPVCYVRRFFSLFEKERRERTARTLRAAGQIGDGEIARTGEMLQKLGLREIQ